ncbi:N-acetylglucosaminyl-phosphatidylinositol de-N-acetylase [Zancudomyces culisetae]|uniref:N-acetylglucosaminylphosphatidylinositol deacetylase n=1 Tax=Zancudomyces culisetae TaxID=1213189 RepID=A0A1R1PWM4_ZANCU|nr:N-acetylglucosaminyl-phosphatidylinositol de-N-acetylase [Zancudomyces culisetae]|eukprot:OMH85337.1 N-acetylglucosaminyl-phosphatidylinositol de-N-acetylase [Zancudomyces culisetae]
MIQSSMKMKLNPVNFYTLKSVQILRKYMVFFDCLFSYGDFFRSKDGLMFISDYQNYKTTVEAMYEHKTQLVWYRRLFIIFSRYMYINTYDLVI